MGIRPDTDTDPLKKGVRFRILSRKVSVENLEFIQKPGVVTKIQFDNNGPKKKPK